MSEKVWVNLRSNMGRRPKLQSCWVGSVPLGSCHPVVVQSMTNTATEDLLAADEVFVMSTVRQVLPVVAVSGTTFEVGPITRRLASGFVDLVAAETA